MTYFDYSNTGIYEEERNTKKTETKETNKRLKSMYKAFYEHIKHEAEKHPGFNAYGYNGLQFLTCFDSYLKSKKKIMCFGKEAHTSAGRLFEYPTKYQSDEYYSYDFAIAHICDKSSVIPKCDCRNTQYLKTRRIISGISENGEDADEDKVLSILNNNLNKTSLGGNFTPCFTEIDLPKNKTTDRWKSINNQIIRDKIVYSPFEFEGVERNIFQHELNILRPTHMIFLSGTGYDNHIIRNFGKAFFDEKIVVNEGYLFRITRLKISKHSYKDEIKSVIDKKYIPIILLHIFPKLQDQHTIMHYPNLPLRLNNLLTKPKPEVDHGIISFKIKIL